MAFLIEENWWIYPNYRGYTRIEDVFPIENEDIPASYVIVYQRVVVLMFFWGYGVTKGVVIWQGGDP